MAVDLSAFVFVSPVPGHIVTRFSTLRPGAAPDMIGHSRAPVAAGDNRGAGTPLCDPDAIVAIPRREWAQFAREYGRALRNGALRERTAAEYAALQASAAPPPTDPAAPAAATPDAAPARRRA